MKKEIYLNIKVENSMGATVRLADLAGKYVVLYFYPKDDTPGCTKEACSIRDWRDEIRKLGAEIIGVSKDSPQSHQKFIVKHKLNFTLWSDTEHKLIEAFGVWKEKKFMGRTYMSTARSTFVLDPEGDIVKTWEDVTPDGHGEEIYDFLKGMIEGR